MIWIFTPLTYPTLLLVYYRYKLNNGQRTIDGLVDIEPSGRIFTFKVIINFKLLMFITSNVKKNVTFTFWSGLSFIQMTFFF